MWIPKLPPPRPPLWFPGKYHEIVVAESLEDPGLIEPQAANVVSVALNCDAGESSPFFGLPTVEIDHPTPHLARDIFDDVADLRHPGEIQDIAGESEQQVADGTDPHSREVFGTLGADTAQELQVAIEGRFVHASSAGRKRKRSECCNHPERFRLP